MAGKGDGAHLGSGVGRISELDRLCPGDHPIDDLIEDVAVDEGSGAGDAGLTGRGEDAGDEAIGGGLKVGVGKHDVG